MLRHDFSLARTLLLAVTLTATGCGVGGGNGGGNDNGVGNPPPPPEPTPNTVQVPVSLSPDQVVAGSTSQFTAKADLLLDVDSDALTGTVTMTAGTATAVQLRNGFAMATGPVEVELQEETPGQWKIPADTVLSTAQLQALEQGRLYFFITGAQQPNGALRGQLLPAGVEVAFFHLSAEQEVPTLSSGATGRGAITLYAGGQMFAIHVNTVDLQEGVASHIHRALAGTNGPVVIELSQDSVDPAHWSAEDAPFGNSMRDDLDNGRLYVNVHTVANSGGEIRAQLPGAEVEVLFTSLSGDDVVSAAAADDASGLLATTLREDSSTATFHLNVSGVDDATGASIRQAPLMQVGPSVVALQQDAEAPGHWSALEVALSAGQYQALEHQGLYVEVESETSPEGALRGQLQPEDSQASEPGNFQVSGSAPANGATVAVFPTTINVNFNNTPLQPDTGQFLLHESGKDNNFNDGNESAIPAVGLTLVGNRVDLDFTGVVATDDTYRLTVVGTGANPVTDISGHVLDGDRDGSAGGDAVITFALAEPEPEPEPEPSVTTLSEIQTQIFNNSCAFSGCHAGASPAAGQNLSAGQAWSNLVDVPSSQNPAFTRVIPGDADNSLIIMKLEGRQPFGSRMPLGGAPLSNSAIQSIREWIDAGAEDN